MKISKISLSIPNLTFRCKQIIIATMAILLLLLPNTMAMQSFTFGKYTLNIGHPEVETIINVPEQAITDTAQFDEYVRLVNTNQEAVNFLQKLGYERIGFIDTDINQAYTIFVADGKITKIQRGLNNPEVTLSGSKAKITDAYNVGKFDEMTKYINMPFLLKLKIWWFT